MKTFVPVLFAACSLAALGGDALASTERAAAPCPKTLNEKKDAPWNMPSQNGGVGAGSWSLSLTGGVAIQADCDSLDASTSVGIRTRLGILSVTPVEVRLTASTNRTGRNALELGYYTFGFEVDRTTLADTTTPISIGKSLSLVVPALNTSGEWGAQTSVLGGTLRFAAEWNTVALGGASITVNVRPDRVEARVITTADADARVRVRGGYEGTVDVNLDVVGKIDFFSLIASGRALMAPTNGVWTADARYYVSIYKALGSRIAVSLPFEYVLFQLDPRNFNDTWSVNKTFNKAF